MLKYYNRDIPICQSQIESIYCDTSQSRKAVKQQSRHTSERKAEPQ
jgi:hypothetical protein